MSKVELLPCPVCKTTNPISRLNVYVKCKKCRANLISVKVVKRKNSRKPKKVGGNYSGKTA